MAVPGDNKETPAKAPAAEAVRIDFDGLDRRIVSVPLPAGIYVGLQVGETGKVYYLAVDLPANLEAAAATGGTGTLHLYDLGTRKDEVLAANVDAYILTADKKKMLVSSPNVFAIVPAAGKPQPGQGRLNVDAIEVRVDPQAEWRQMFNEAWRINRDYFYDPGMHGADWKAMKAKYAGFLADVPCRADLNRLIQWMCSELSVGHHRVGGGDFPNQPKTVPGGLLGADYAVENGRYRVKKVYGGLNWNPELRSPLTEPGVDVKAGEYLLAVNGKDLKAPDNLYARFENTAGKIVEITVGPNADGTGARTVEVVPVASESGLRNRDWVEGNLRKVEAATGGRVAYVYVPNTTTAGYVYFKRYFFPQADKDGDHRRRALQRRRVARRLLHRLAAEAGRRLLGHALRRRPQDAQRLDPGAQGHAHQRIGRVGRRPAALDVAEVRARQARRDADLGRARRHPRLPGAHGRRPWSRRPTWPSGRRTASSSRTKASPPDIEVEQTPKDVIAGRDPQLERAIQVVMEELAKNPPKKPVRPPFPVRVK